MTITEHEIARLPHGLYRIFWKGEPNRPSFAAIGSDTIGKRWIAPCNWTQAAHETRDRNRDPTRPIGSVDHWHEVDRVELITPCDSPGACSDRQQLVKLGRETIKTSQAIDPDIMSVVRDLFLTGQDVDAIGILATQLGMVPKAPASPSAALIQAVRALIKSADSLLPKPIPSGSLLASIAITTLEALREALIAVEESAREQRKARTPETPTRGFVIDVGDRVRVRQQMGANTLEFEGDVVETSRSGSSMLVRSDAPNLPPTIGDGLHRLSPQEVIGLRRASGDWIEIAYSDRVRFEPRRTRLGPTDFEVRDPPSASQCNLDARCTLPRGHDGPHFF